ncbi:DUF1302 family protein [Elongatibacter sediminis]|uniref:DUF1302 family protein n=1 Tax=Elongatibacter sediminis TaxID=3119006 RepID=A0AAW9RDA3_9GAMM
MKSKTGFSCPVRLLFGSLAVGLFLLSNAAQAIWYSNDRSLEVRGFIDNTTHVRTDSAEDGLSKMRNRVQVEFSKFTEPTGMFSEFSFHGILRASYDAAYDLDDDLWGDTSGGPVFLASEGGPALGLPGQVPWGAAASPFESAVVLPGTNPFVSGTSPYLNGFFLGTSPNDFMRLLNGEMFDTTGGLPGFGGIQLAYPTRPCDVDPRGCIAGYMDADSDNLRFPEFNDRYDWMRELYLDATIPFDGGSELNFRIGRQQVVWGRTDLFRVLDQVNPIDFSIQNIYEEFEDSRIPMGIFSAEYRAGVVGQFDDLNFQFIWKFEDFRPHTLGQGGEPYTILGAGDLFRALSTCWHYGCTVGNFAPNQTGGASLPPPIGLGAPTLGNGNSTGTLATTFPAHTIGIRGVDADRPDGAFEDPEIGLRVEGLYRGIGFSFNFLYFHQQLPSLHGGSEGPAAINPFLCDPALNPVCGALEQAAGESYLTEMQRPYLLAFDIHFPRVTMFGASADFYVESLKSSIRVELAHTSGEEFVNTLRPSLYSESDVVRWVIGIDRPTFIRFLNPNRSFLVSLQVFGQHLLDHELITTPGGKAGMPDWENNILTTLLIQGGYFNDRLTPTLLLAWDSKAHSMVVGPSVNWKFNNEWTATLGANLKFGTSKNDFDDCRACNQFPPFTDPAEGTPGAGTLPVGQSVNRLAGFAPLGAFRAGPIGMAQAESEIQFLLRYSF